MVLPSYCIKLQISLGFTGIFTSGLSVPFYACTFILQAQCTSFEQIQFLMEEKNLRSFLLFGFDFDIISWIRIPNICCGPDAAHCTVPWYLDSNHFPGCPETDMFSLGNWHSPRTFFSVENSFQGDILSWRFMHCNRESGKIL